MSKAQPPIEIQGNKVLECHMNRDFPVSLVEITNQEWDEHGKFAVVTDCGWNPLEGWNEIDFQFFDTLELAYKAYDQKTGIYKRI